jgi:hypothetical protein
MPLYRPTACDTNAIVQKVWLKDYAKHDVHTSSQESDGESPPAKRSRFFNPFAVNIRLLQSRFIAVIGDE